MTGKAGPFRLDLGDPVEGMLRDFCAVNYDSNMTEVVRRALLKFIPAELARDHEKRREYDELQATRRSERGDNIRLVRAVGGQ